MNLACTLVGSSTHCNSNIPHTQENMDLIHLVDGKALEWQQACMHDEQHFVHRSLSLAVPTTHTACGLTVLKHIWTNQIVSSISVGNLRTFCPNGWHVTGSAAKA